MDGKININKKNKYFWIVIVFAILLVGGTLASVISNILVSNGRYNTVSTCLDVDYDITNDDGTMPITGALFPTVNFYGGLSGKVGLKINDSCSLEGIGSLYLNVSNNTSPIYVQTVDAHCEDSRTLETLTDYDDESACTAIDGNVWVTNGTALKYAVFDTNEITGETIPVSVGYVNKVGSIEIYNNIPVTKTQVNFYVYIWLDGNLSDNSYANLSFDGNVSATVVQKPEGLFEVTFDLHGGSIDTNDENSLLHEQLIEYNEPGEYEFLVPYDGLYKLEVWGAQGGSYNSIYYGGYGGYSVGNIELKKDNILYVNVGGRGESSCVTTDCQGGYNGGGNGGMESYDTSNYQSGGGGATHIATQSGQLFTLSPIDNVKDILIVAGGGGGSYYHTGGESVSSFGGSAGGYVGNDGILLSLGPSGGGGTQLTGGSAGYRGNVGNFGQGGNGISDLNGENGGGASGGGGGYYGGGSSGHSSPGGGSGYIGNDLLNSKAMYCYNCEISSDVSTLTYSTTKVSSIATSNYAKTGDGAARLSILKLTNVVVSVDEDEKIPVPSKSGFVFKGWNTESNGLGQFITSTSEISDNITLYAIWESIPILSISCSNFTNGQEPYLFIYDGDCTYIDDDYGDWRIKFLTSGNLTLASTVNIDMFLVGGGGAGGGANNISSSGGGGGYTKTQKNLTLLSGSYKLTIGAGGVANATGAGGDGGISEFVISQSNIISVDGGKGGGYAYYSSSSDSSLGTGGGNGGSGGGLPESIGGSYGGAGGGEYEDIMGDGQGFTTCEFGEGTLSGCINGDDYAYAGGGGGSGALSASFGGVGGGGLGPLRYVDGTYIDVSGEDGQANTGGGGGGAGAKWASNVAGGDGGSGIIIIRNAR